MPIADILAEAPNSSYRSDEPPVVKDTIYVGYGNQNRESRSGEVHAFTR